MTHLGNYKLVFLGDQAVGKTSIITCFMYGNFDTNYQVRLLPISLHLHGSIIGTHVSKINQYNTFCGLHWLLLIIDVNVSFLMIIGVTIAYCVSIFWQATIGIDFLSKTMRHEDTTFRLQLW